MSQELIELKRRIEQLEAQSRKQPFELGGNAAGAGGGVPVCITAKVDYQTYVVDVYADGKFADNGAVPPVFTAGVATDTGKYLRIIQIATGAAINVGTWLLASPFGDHYEADISRWQ